ncbi:Type VI secretion protein [Beijerinckiaceae bacterium RH AL1]|nr:type VI secretion system baseplate subunit TssK [Beijerinckiaceae bacterium]VVB42467.1 Type VI secretion protein [Beijerinckiaceae bacterium RH AL8]VVB42468.1 Type VI secretion protein [Beijerinckiaceae bacterium RH CH11]VVC53324.1 Type VI secretion protein [Beijerinckiaceae bacterium RH AL1]
MLAENRVVWSEGMFLRVHHFQQADRWTERYVRAATRELRPYPWGLAEFAINRELLAVGKFALTYARGIFTDGTPFEAPGDTDLPAPLELVEGVQEIIVHLALPSRQPGTAEVGTARREDAGTRYRRHDYDASDANSDSFSSSGLEVARLRLSYAPSNGPLAGLERIPVARITEVRSDLAVLLDDKFIAPVLNCAAEPPLLGLVGELQGLVTHRADALAGRMADPTVRGTAEIADFLLLQTLNRFEPVLRHAAAQAGRMHPEAFYTTCLALAGELATFTTDAKRSSRFPDYRHDDLKATFEAVFRDLRASLSALLEQTAVPIELQERRHGVRVGIIQDRQLILTAAFVLAVRANMPVEQLRRQLPNQIKIGSVEQIAQLVNVALPGVPVRPLSVAPRQLPYRAGTVYFELDTTTPLWRELDASGAVALHVAGSFPDIEMELWAIKG